MRRLAVAGVVLQVSTPAPAYDWYERLHNVDGDSCCRGKDCQPGDFCLLPGGLQGLDIPSHRLCWDQLEQGAPGRVAR